MQSTSLNNHFQHLPKIWKQEYLNSEDLNESIVLSKIETALLTAQKKNRSVLVEALNQQYSETEFKTIHSIISSLANENTFTVTTGHQLCLLGGPLFFIYKIAGVIQLCKDLKLRHPDKNFVPVFWMASEDHDFEEINHFYLYNQKYQWKSDEGGAVGRFSTNGIAEIIAELESKKGNLPYADELITIFKKSYAQKNLALATRSLVHLLFSNDELICIDADNKQLKKLFVPILKEEIEKHSTHTIITDANLKLIQNGHQAQVNPREINLFYLQEQSRVRITKIDESTFGLDGSAKQWKKDELLREIEESPENFSPNVLLRPIYQESILPNIAYIGGPGEIAYWLQLPNLFKHFNLNFPALLLRKSFLLIDAVSEKKMLKLEYKAEDLFRDALELEKEFITKNAQIEIELSNYKKESELLFQKLSTQVEQIDGSLKSQIMAEHKKLENFLNTLETKLRRTEKQKHEQSISQIHSLKDKFFPLQSPQERIENFTAYYWKYGANFIEFITKHASPLNPTFEIVYLDEE